MSRWRTVIAVELLGLDLLAGLWIVCHTEGLVALASGAIFTAFGISLVGLGGVLGGKSAVEHLANGNGIKGAVATLMTDAKPGEPLPKE
jgi:hypothetical protein